MKRPVIITIICITGYLSVLFVFPQVFSPQVKKLGLLMPAVYGTLVAASFISCVGLWYLKQWGAELYVGSFFGRTLFYLLTDQVGVTFYTGTAVSLIYIMILMMHYRRMSAQL